MRDRYFDLEIQNKDERNERHLYKFKPDVPFWVTQTVMDAHGSRMPDDWVFRLCAYAFNVDLYGCDEDGVHDAARTFAETHASIYDKKVAFWYAEFYGEDTMAEAEEEICEEPRQEMTVDRLRALQTIVIRHIAEKVFLSRLENDDVRLA